MLRDDSDLRADSGGRVVAVRDVIEGGQPICGFISTILVPAWASMEITQHMINGLHGLAVWDRDHLY
ncbi:hypothetical protein, partial [Escherichia coli]|uniref:hypothetical protein n=1 Tax=Escherichia coli TaxID=562 RepID=UPI00141256C3